MDDLPSAGGDLRCPLCSSDRVRPFAELRASRYFRCEVCRLTFLDPAQRPGREVELAHYGTHENDPADPGYRRFLDRLAQPLAERLPPAAEGLDYGSGPGPTLSLILEECGFRMWLYDPYFAPEEEVLRRDYDFITCTEVVEHFFDPAAEFGRLDRLLRPGGWLGIMTEVLEDDSAFERWRYARDPTHVCFYRWETLRWIAARLGWVPHSPARHVVLYEKPGRVPDPGS